VIDFAACDIGASLRALEQQAVTWRNEGLIDPISDLAGKAIYVYHGTLDPLVLRPHERRSLRQPWWLAQAARP
jgi:hypothetical protein